MEKKQNQQPPTLMIGLGGTGANAVELIEEQLKRRQGDAPRFLCIDTEEPQEQEDE